ncbi:hypothetical protein KC622_01565 [Candidatus Dojkabacteria bacterium]|uniref:Uncharacterized protein n=1 Tax=Candidatus Dojkabacteria bacterium TaxID=2099670 RepID=A0A955HYX8_9BACT|nr:hypothetical protein [Candidatus Dojkabacteria bacterium]MCB9790820.1 hypothetical protein [Candidatus Nomurabacteria bacterium]
MLVPSRFYKTSPEIKNKVAATAFLFLACLLVAGVWYLKQDSTVIAQPNDLSANSSIRSSSSDLIALDPRPVSELASSSGEVLQANVSPTSPQIDFSPTGCNDGRRYELQPVCVTGSAEYSIGVNSAASKNADGSVTIRNNVVLELWKVTYPGGLINGMSEKIALGGRTLNEAEKYFKDRREIASTKHTSVEYYFYPAIGDLFGSKLQAQDNPDYSQSWLSPLGYYGPGDAQDAENLFSSDVKSSYRPNACVDGGEGCNDKNTVSFQIDCDPQRDENCNTSASNTPAGSGGYLGATYSPNSVSYTRNYSGDICSATSVNLTTVPEIQASHYVGCLSKRSVSDFAKAITVSAQNAAECTTNPSSPNCQATTIFGVKIDALNGSSYDCKDGQCGIKLSDTIRNINDVPGDDEHKISGLPDSSSEPRATPFYVKTSCQIRVNYTKVIDIPCLWDMSVYKAEYERNAAENGPNQLVSFDEWFNNVVYQANCQNAGGCL